MRTLLTVLFAALASMGVAADVDLHPGRNANLHAGATFTWDAYLPQRYFDEPQARLPVIYLQTPGGPPVSWNNYGIEPWADRRGVIIIGINDSGNDLPRDAVHAAQAAVLAASEATLRLHPALRYAMGTSGGGMESVALVQSAPDRFAGVFVNVHSAGPPAKHMACVYVGGETDTTHPIAAVRATAARAKSQGNPVRFIADPGNHDTAGHYGERAIPLLDWMLFSTCTAHPKLTPADLEAGVARIAAEVDAIAALTDPRERITRSESLLEIPSIANDKRLGARVRTVWAQSALDANAAGGDAVATHLLLTHVSEHPLFATIDPKIAKQLVATLKQLRSADPVKSEWAALQAYRSVEDAERKAGNTKGGLREAAQNYAAIATRFPGTAAGKDADAAAKRLATRIDAKP